MQYISSFLEIVLESDIETGFTPFCLCIYADLEFNDIIKIINFTLITSLVSSNLSNGTTENRGTILKDMNIIYCV